MGLSKGGRAQMPPVKAVVTVAEGFRVFIKP